MNQSHELSAGGELSGLNNILGPVRGQLLQQDNCFCSSQAHSFIAYLDFDELVALDGGGGCGLPSVSSRLLERSVELELD